jgi:hypothetical protein
MPKDETISEQEERRQTDAWESMIADWIAFERRDVFTTADVLKQCLSIDAGRMDKPAQQRVGQILKGMGYESQKDWNNGSQRRVWRNPAAELPLAT